MYPNEKILKSISAKLGAALLIFLGLFSAAGVVLAVATLILTAGGDYTVTYEGEVFLNILEMVLRVVAFTMPVFIFGAMMKNDKSGLRRAPITLRGKKTENKFALVIGSISLIWGAAFVNSLIMTLLPGFSEALEEVTQTGTELTPLMIFLTVVSTAVIPGIFEELLYRGLILGNLIPFGRGYAVVFSGLMFGIMHQNPAQLFYATAAGLVLGYVYIKTESFLLCAVIHFSNNFISVLQEVIGNKLEEASADLWNAGITAVVFAGGFVSIIFLLSKKARRAGKDNGSFGVVLPPSDSYEEIPVPTDRKLFGYFSVTMIVFTALCFFSTLATVLMLMVML